MPMPIWLYLVTICVVVREIYCNACLWFRGAHLSVVLRGAILTICLSVGSQGSLVCGFAGCWSYYFPVCGFVGLTCLWFHRVLFLLFACLWFRGACLTGFAVHFVLSFFVIEFLS